MPTFLRSATTNADGDTVTQADSVTGTESAKVQLALTNGKVAQLTTRTDNDTGVITSTAHGLSASDFVSFFWTNPDGSEGCRMNMDITGVTTDTLTVDLGQGDNLPANLTNGVVGLVASRVVAWDGTANGMIGFSASLGNRRGSVTAQAVGTLIGLAGTDLIKHLKTQSPGYTWLSGVDGAFAFTGNILMVTAALGDTQAAGVATIKRLDT